MKTPRHVLLGKHAPAEPKLDNLRQRFITMLPSLATEPSPSDRKVLLESERPGWLELLYSIRWHLAGLSSAWVLVVLLRISAQAPATPVQLSANQISPQTIIVSLKANRLQIMELGDATSSGGPALPPARPATRRSSLEGGCNYC